MKVGDEHPADAVPGLTPEDRTWLERAVILGRQGRGHVHPNPEVGCVVVRDGRAVAEGHHARFGGPHAEAAALADAGEAAAGATVYVSLEPCSHHGKTPPCSEVLVQAGVARVVYGAADPSPDGGGGAAILRDAKVETVGPAFSLDRARRENPAFFHWHEVGLPWLQVKLAVSVDGRIAAAPGARTSISGPEAAVWTHEVRASVDAILVGRGTALVDDPSLTVREGVSCRRQPARVVLDSGAQLSPDASVFTADGGAVHVFVGSDAPADRVSALESAGATVDRVAVPDDQSTGVSLPTVLSQLGERGIRSVLCEGGAELASALLSQSLAQRLHLIVAPLSFGHSGVPAFTDALDLDPEAWRAFDASRALGPTCSLGRDSLVSFRRDY